MNTGGKIVFGMLVDKIGANRSSILFAVLVFAGILVLSFIRTDITYLLGSGLYGCGYAIAAVGCVVLTRDLFGVENYSKIYPTVSLVGVIANAIFTSVVGYLFDWSGDYISTFILMAVMTIGFAVSIYFAYKIERR